MRQDRTSAVRIGDIPTLYARSHHRAVRGAAASLMEFDLQDISVPLEEVERILIARYEKRHEINPALFEHVVADVFRGKGYRSVVTARTADGGVDVILSDDQRQIGVQVKRWKNAIKAEQIRALAGALVLRGLTRGVFVTTSRFQPGAESTAEQYRLRGYAIELFDSHRFLEALRLSQRPAYHSLEEFPLDSWLQRLEEQLGGWVSI